MIYFVMIAVLVCGIGGVLYHLTGGTRAQKRRNQEAFDTMVERLADGKGRAQQGISSICQYRTPSGNRCVVGALLTEDEAIKADQIGGSASNIQPVFPRLIGIDADLMMSMQGLHDNLNNWSGLEFIAWASVRGIGRAFGLNTKKVPA